MPTDELEITAVTLTDRGIELDGFRGEGNPSEQGSSDEGLELVEEVYLTIPELEALRAVLDRETTSRPSYDGLRQLLSLSHPQAEALLGFLRRVV